MQETIEVHELSAMQKLALASDRLAEIESEAKKWKAEYEKCLGEILETSPEFGPSKFLKATGSKGDAFQDDHVMIIRTPVVKRIIRQDEFIKKYKDEFMQIGVVTIKDAEAAIGKARLNEICDLKTDYRYKVIRTDV